MYARDRTTNPSHTGRAFEEAYMRQKSAQPTPTDKELHTPVGSAPIAEQGAPEGPSAPKPSPPSAPAKRTYGIERLLGVDKSDALLILLILFFLTDVDAENDVALPLLLTLLLLF